MYLHYIYFMQATVEVGAFVMLIRCSEPSTTKNSLLILAGAQSLWIIYNGASFSWIVFVVLLLLAPLSSALALQNASLKVRISSSILWGMLLCTAYAATIVL
jgi:hypothetical protein